jgi:signal transduction histidine kinase
MSSANSSVVPPASLAERPDQTFRLMAEAMPQLVWSTRADGYHDYFNARWYDYTGMPRPDDRGGEHEISQGWNWKNFLHPEDYDRALAQWSHCLATGDPYEIEYRFKEAATGRYRWFLGRALPLRREPAADGTPGEIVRWFGTCTDIEEQKRATRFAAAQGGEIRAQRDTLAAQARELERQNEQLQQQAVELEMQSAQLQEQATELELSHEQLQQQATELEAQAEELVEQNVALATALATVARERARFETTLAHLPVGVLIAEAPSGRIVYGNRQIVSIFRHPVLPSPDVGAYGEWVSYHADGRQVAAHEYPLARTLERGEPAHGEYHYQRGDGTRAWVRITAAPIREEGGALTGGVVVVEDVDAERRAAAEREALLASIETERARLAGLLEGAPAVMAIYTGPDHVVSYVNPTWERTVGKPGAVGRPFREVFPEFAHTGLFERLDRIQVTGEPYAVSELRVPLQRTPDGTLEDSWWDLVWTPVPRSGGAAGHDILVHAVEVTTSVRARREVERARAAAEEANRAKSEFLANMSHELRTPLNAIGGFAELLELELHGPVTDAQREALGRIRRSQQHLLGLITQILDYARIEAGRAAFHPSDVPAAEAVEAVRELIEPLARAKRLALAVHAAAADQGLVARADRDRLAQVLLNLLSNAVKFTGEGGRIDVSWGAAEHAGAPAVAITVRDTGLGIPADRLAAVFEPFVQVATGRTRSSEGTGLGLAISRDLARGMGGDLTAESTPGVGSTFTIVVPRAGAARGAPVARP